MILGTIIGLVGSAIPEVLKIFQKSQDNKLELEKIKLKINHAETLANLNLNIENIKADASETRALLRHDSSGNQSGWVASLRGSVRPLITYFFFIIFASVQFYGAYNLETADAVEFIWNENTQELFGAVIGFWFGNRSIEKWRLK